jgi:hypothetical protein
MPVEGLPYTEVRGNKEIIVRWLSFTCYRVGQLAQSGEEPGNDDSDVIRGLHYWRGISAATGKTKPPDIVIFNVTRIGP